MPATGDTAPTSPCRVTAAAPSRCRACARARSCFTSTQGRHRLHAGSAGLHRRVAEFEAAGTTVIGVSKDSVKAHDKFCKKHGLRIVLASDENGTTCEDYGVWVEKSMYGKTYMGVERTTFLIDGAGKIARVWRRSASRDMPTRFWPRPARCERQLARMAVEVLTTADRRAKTALGRRHAAAWFAAREGGRTLPLGRAEPPLRPRARAARASPHARRAARRPGSRTGGSRCCTRWRISN